MKPRYTDAFWGEHPFDGDMILIKNKNKNADNVQSRSKGDSILGILFENPLKLHTHSLAYAMYV